MASPWWSPRPATELETGFGCAAWLAGIGPTVTGRNGGGDLYYTDGEIWVLRLVEACKKNDAPVEAIPSPAMTEFKDQLWHSVVEAIGK